ncbi:hypothetical protein FHJ30_20165 [Arthrobacter sp. BB-1]|nr:hypothetical protein FHJ30_20165 [Arthrobacter sp. BB-1]
MSNPETATLRVGLEELGGTSWWASLLSTLFSQYGSTQLRFVGAVNGEKRYTSSTFTAPRPVSPMPPEDDWAPGMRRSLQELVQEIESDGWRQTGRGRERWELIFQKEARVDSTGKTGS